MEARMSAPLLITRRSVADVVILQLEGSLIFDEADHHLLREQVTDLVASGQRWILLDLRGVTHMDSGGVGALAAVSLHVVKRNGALKLLAPSERVLRVLHITHLESVFEVFAEESDAVRSFRRRTMPEQLTGAAPTR
jgi:anti-sigma B factor antagonist